MRIRLAAIVCIMLSIVGPAGPASLSIDPVLANIIQSTNKSSQLYQGSFNPFSTSIQANQQVHFAAIGDIPYHDITDIPNLLDTFDQVGQNGMPFLIHVGDIWSSCTTCSEKRYKGRRALFARCPIPFVIVPGDNEFTDCPRENIAPSEELIECLCKTNAEHKNSTELLSWEVALKRFVIDLLGNPPLQQTILGNNPSVPPIQVIRMEGRKDNVRWNYQNMGFIGINLPGSDSKTLLPLPGEDNVDPKPDKAGEEKFIDDNFRFINTGFEEYAQKDAIVLFMQSDPNRRKKSNQNESARPNIVQQFNNRLKEAVRQYNKPVLLIHGDEHTCIFGSQYQTLNNWWRLEVPTSGWVEVIFDRKIRDFKIIKHTSAPCDIRNN